MQTSIDFAFSFSGSAQPTSVAGMTFPDGSFAHGSSIMNYGRGVLSLQQTLQPKQSAMPFMPRPEFHNGL
jgi:hypothetical protein